MESLLNKIAGPQDLLKGDSNTGVAWWNLGNFKEHAGGCFWKFGKCLCWTNVYPTTKQDHLQSNFEKKLPSCYREKMRWERPCQLKSCLYLVYFDSLYPNILNVLLKNLQKKMHNEKPLLKYWKTKQSPGGVLTIRKIHKKTSVLESLFKIKLRTGGLQHY